MAARRSLLSVLSLAIVALLSVSLFAHAAKIDFVDEDNLCQKDEDCPTTDNYCKGIEWSVKLSKQVGYCAPKFVGYCRDNGDCATEAGEVCVQERSGTLHGRCFANPMVERAINSPLNPIKSPLDHGILPVALDKTVKAMSDVELMEFMQHQQKFEIESDSDSHAEHRCGNEHLEDNEWFNGKLYKKMVKKTTHGDDLHERRKHHQVKKHVHDTFGIMSDAFAESLSAIPVCGVGRCDNPVVRDSYKDFAPKTVNLDWLVFNGTTFGADPKTAETHIAAVTADLNGAYSPMKLKFNSRLKVFNLPSNFKGFAVGKTDEECKIFMKETGRMCINYLSLMMAARGQTWQKQGAFQVLAVDFVSPSLNGFAFFPWATIHGMVVMATRQIRAGKATMKHELGHAFSLKHTFHGISEVEECGKCYENKASDFHGDLCSDTNPEPRNWICGNPPISSYPDNCTARKAWIDTPYDNIMTYGEDTCRQKFTPQQVRRVRCWMDDFQNKFW